MKVLSLKDIFVPLMIWRGEDDRADSMETGPNSVNVWPQLEMEWLVSA